MEVVCLVLAVGRLERGTKRFGTSCLARAAPPCQLVSVLLGLSVSVGFCATSVFFCWADKLQAFGCGFQTDVCFVWLPAMCGTHVLGSPNVP